MRSNSELINKVSMTVILIRDEKYYGGETGVVTPRGRNPGYYSDFAALVFLISDVLSC